MSATQDLFFDIFSTVAGVPLEELATDATLDSLDVDSLLLIELTVAVQKRTGVVIEETDMVPEATLGEIVALLDKQLQEA
ncbi:acyl carrier protein [Nocardiopsis aegyptia]|uniref:Acyl carrier protein n=1 Tax=Nocardiopsis aegyptia TaxID=220378 RepID=A0A7Z0EP03_9ACTN|nr:acyl carrier protein [Nocardiopsis aegyptia]NYJ35579.1 acyl carrier protein [Nocardiopsis aegyptia]